MSYQVNQVRKDFPSLNSGIAYFDGPGGTQTPQIVGDAIAKAIARGSATIPTVIPAKRSLRQEVRALL